MRELRALVRVTKLKKKDDVLQKTRGMIPLVLQMDKLLKKDVNQDGEIFDFSMIPCRCWHKLT